MDKDSLLTGPEAHKATTRHLTDPTHHWPTTRNLMDHTPHRPTATRLRPATLATTPTSLVNQQHRSHQITTRLPSTHVQTVRVIWNMNPHRPGTRNPTRLWAAIRHHQEMFPPIMDQWKMANQRTILPETSNQILPCTPTILHICITSNQCPVLLYNNVSLVKVKVKVTPAGPIRGKLIYEIMTIILKIISGLGLE